MNCPLCDVALKIASHRGLSIRYCPLCGGTWLEEGVLDRLESSRAPIMPQFRLTPRRLVRIAAITVLILVGCVIAAVSVGAVKLWPTFRGWAEALLSGNETAVALQIRGLTERLGNERLSSLTQLGLNTPAISEMLANPKFEPLMKTVLAAPEIAPLIQDGSYLKVLEEAGRQNVLNLLDVKAADIASPEIKVAVGQIQEVLQRVKGAEALGVADPAVIGLIRTEAFEQLRRTGFFASMMPETAPAPPMD